MATAAELPVNGSYAQQGYDGSNYASAGANSNAPSYSASASAPTQSSNTAASEIPKDEVGWYFVEQYYTTLSRSPDKLYLFYNKRSQFVSGNEEDKVNVCVGQKAINERIKDLDFHDTKVRVTNVDSQGSDANIVIQVIGEISNKGQPHKRFAQTFVLAEQTNGYFVLNDIFRYLAEEPEEEEEELQQDASAPVVGAQEPAPTAAAPEDAALNHSNEIANSEEDLVKVDHKLEEVAHEESAQVISAPAGAVNGTPAPENAEVVEAEEAPAAAVSTSEEAPSQEPEAAVEEEVAQPEKPKDPAPTPTAPKAATPAAPSKPAVPKSWAALAASAHKVATPAVPAAATPQQPSQPKSATSAPNQPLAVPEKSSAPAREPSPANSQGDASGWQTAGTKKEQARGQTQAPSDADQRRAYIKNVYSQVEEGALKAALTKFGEIEHLDISRQKNCAFVDFKTAAAFQAAVNANPHTVNGLEIKVEERKLRPQQGFGGNNFRGGPGRGRGFPGQNRGGFARGGRGGSVRGGRGGAPQES